MPLPVLWSQWLPDGGLLQWMPGDLTAVPTACGACGEPVRVSLCDGEGCPIELKCHGGHQWFDVLTVLQERIALAALG